MSDPDRGRKKRGKRVRPTKYDTPHRADYRERKESEERKEEPPTPRPIILANPDRPQSTVPPTATEPAENPPASESTSDTSTAPSTVTTTPSKTPVFTLKTRESSPSVRNHANAIPSMLAGEGLPSSMYVAQRPPDTAMQSTSPPSIATNPQMSEPVKIIDENLSWNNAGMDVLLDQSDYFVIGVVGLQGSGKSTIMSLLASAEHIRREYVFPVETYDDLEMSSHRTEGVDMYITQERIILLDTQPVMSASVLDRIIRLDKKGDGIPPENTAQVKSLQMASFLMAVCNVVIVCMDWFADIDLLKFVRTAEMLKPATPSGSSSSSSSSTDTSTAAEEHEEYYPHTVFLLNRAERADFTRENYASMQKYLHSVYDKSCLKYTGRVSMANVVPSLAMDNENEAVNLFVLSDTQPRKKHELGFAALPAYCGHPATDVLMADLRKQLFSLPRTPLTHSTLSEKNWFHYAARTWESVKKSTLISEYGRLLNI